MSGLNPQIIPVTTGMVSSILKHCFSWLLYIHTFVLLTLTFQNSYHTHIMSRKLKMKVCHFSNVIRLMRNKTMIQLSDLFSKALRPRENYPQLYQ